MAYVLGSGIHSCETSGRLVFLDLPRDRYFCLDDAAEAVLRRAMLAGLADDADDAILEGLRRQGILERTGRPPAPSSAERLEPATETLLDRVPTHKSGWSKIFRAGAAVLTARVSLRARGLAATLDALARQRTTAMPSEYDTTRMTAIAAAFARLDLYLSPLDQCLPRSIALASVLARRRVSASLVIGVRLRPFLAHSWVQSQALVVNDRPDIVGTFAPILAI